MKMAAALRGQNETRRQRDAAAREQRKKDKAASSGMSVQQDSGEPMEGTNTVPVGAGGDSESDRTAFEWGNGAGVDAETLETNQ